MEYTDGLDVLTQHQVTLSLLSYMCLARYTLSQPNSITKYLGALVFLGCSSTISVLSLGMSQMSIATTSLLFSSTWSRFTCPSGFVGSLEEWQTTYHRFTPPTKHCTGVLSINNKATIQRCVVQLTLFCWRYDYRKRYKTKDWHMTHSAHIHLW